MLLAEYNEAEQLRMTREEGFEDGLQEGRISAMVAAIKTITESFGVSVDEAMTLLKVSQDERTVYAERMKQS